MDRQWIENAKLEKAEELATIRKRILDDCKSFRLFDDEDKQIIEEEFDKYIEQVRENEFCANELLLCLDMNRRIRNRHKEDDRWSAENDLMAFEHLRNIGGMRELHKTIYLLGYGYDRYLDSEPQEFDGDIIITDPCYITRDGDWSAEGCDYGSEMQRLGLDHSMTRDTIYGDWGCTVYDDNTGEKLGEFCADAGMVGVFLLDEVLAYNPIFDYHKEKDWTTTWIKDFKGTVQFVVEYDCGVFGEDSDYAGQPWEDYSVVVVGHGVNKVTGERIDFRSKQTSL